MASDGHVPKFNRSMVALHLGRGEDARGAFEELAEVYRSRALTFDLATALQGQAVALARLGRHDELAPLVEQASAIMGDNAQETDVALLWQWLAAALVGTSETGLFEHAADLCVKSWLSLGNAAGAAAARKQFGMTEPG